jgi:hypothetical protein
VSLRHAARANSAARQLHVRQLEELGLIPTADELELHMALSTAEQMGNVNLEAAFAWLQRLYEGNQQRCVYASAALAYVLEERWLFACWASPLSALEKLRGALRAHFFWMAELDMRKRFGLLMRNLQKRLLRG